MTFRIFVGIVVTVLAVAATLTVAVFWITIVWVPTPIPVTAATAYIPPAAYALVLYVIWSNLQRIQAHNRPEGNVWWWLDLVPSVALAVFMAATFGLTIYKGFDALTIVSAGAFFVGTVVDFIFNGNHLMDDRTPYVRGSGSASEDLLHDIVTGAATAMPPVTIKPKVIIEPEYVLIGPDGRQQVIQQPQIAAAGGPATPH